MILRKGDAYELVEYLCILYHSHCICSILFLLEERKYLWMAPLISAAISVVISLLSMPSILSDAEHRNMFFGISIMLHILIVVGLTVIAYAAVRFLAKK